MTYRRRRRAAVAALVAAIAAVAAVAYVALAGGGPEPEPALDRYLAAWSRGDDAAAARATDRPSSARDALEASRDGLDHAKVSARRTGLERSDGRATARVRVTWKVPRFGDFAYDTTIALVQREDRWLVAFSPKAIHPRLRAGTRLGTAVDRPDRGDLLDRRGRKLITERSVMDVALEADRVRDPAATAATIAGLIDEVDAADLPEAPGGCGPRPLHPRHHAAHGGVRRDRGSAEPAAGHLARALRGAARAVARLRARRAGRGRGGDGGAARGEPPPRAGRGDRPVRARGRLRAPPGRARRRPDRGARPAPAASSGATLLERRASKGHPVRTTLDLDVQAAAEAALGDSKGNAALVAVRPSTGDVLAVANRPADSSLNRAFTGLYPPGSTFKVVTTAALLRAGLGTGETVELPRHHRRRRPLVPQLRGRRGGRRPVPHRLREVVQHGLHLARRPAGPGRPDEDGARLRPRGEARARPPGGRGLGAGGDERGRPRRDDDRAGPHRGQPARDGWRRRDRRGRALARAAARRRRPAAAPRRRSPRPARCAS